MINNKYLDSDEFVKHIQLFDDAGQVILDFDSAKMYNDATSDWVFACIETERYPVRITGIIKHPDKKYIDAIANAGNSPIKYGSSFEEDGYYVLEWEYRTDSE